MVAAADSAFGLEGRVALITGGTRGIGAAVALEFAAAGARVIVTGREAARAEEAAAAIRASGAEALGIQYTAGSMDSLRALVARITQEVGRLDILVNNAAILKPHFIEKLGVAEFDELFAVNVRAALFLTQALQPLLLQSAAAAIINITAAGGHAPMAGIGAYCATKAALINLTHTLAKELGARRITVNAVAPGPVETALFTHGKSEAQIEATAKMIPLGRLGQPDDIAGVVSFLAGPDSGWVNGQIIRANGGVI